MVNKKYFQETAILLCWQLLTGIREMFYENYSKVNTG